MYHLNETSNEDYPVALMANGQTDTLPVTNGHHNGKEEVTLFLSREMLAFNSETTGSLISDRSVNQIVGNYVFAMAMVQRQAKGYEQDICNSFPCEVADGHILKFFHFIELVFSLPIAIYQELKGLQGFFAPKSIHQVFFDVLKKNSSSKKLETQAKSIKTLAKIPKKLRTANSN